MSKAGLVCPECKRRLYLDPPQGKCRTFWESQPVAYSLDRKPCFVYSLMWDDYRIRSLHPADSETDPRGAMLHRQDEVSTPFFFLQRENLLEDRTHSTDNFLPEIDWQPDDDLPDFS